MNNFEGQESKLDEEKKKIYENPNDDPAVKEIERNISEIANKDHQRVEGRLGSDSLEDNFKRVSGQQWESFLNEYPEKAEGYRNKLEPIKSAFERREKVNQLNTEGEQKIERSPKKDKEFQAKILGAKDFREFWQAIDDNGGVEGSQKHYEPGELSSLVARVANGDNPKLLTSQFGLRQKVLDLIKLEKLQAELRKK